VNSLQDLRYALRAFRTRPLHAGVTVLVLAIAIGANTTVFSLINGLFLRPLPYPDGDRLVMVYDSYEKLGLVNAGTSIPDYLDRRAQAQSLTDLAIFSVSGRALGGEGPTEEVAVGLASPSLFGVLGVAPQIGRAFTEQEATPGNDGVAMLSNDLWSSVSEHAPTSSAGSSGSTAKRYRSSACCRPVSASRTGSCKCGCRTLSRRRRPATPAAEISSRRASAD
jgi:MacB-like periplasmic core domain